MLEYWASTYALDDKRDSSPRNVRAGIIKVDAGACLKRSILVDG